MPSIPGGLHSLLLKASLSLCCLLPFLIFFDPFRNIDLQFGVLLVSGVLAWLYLILDKNALKLQTFLYPVFLFLGAGTISAVLNPDPFQNFFGASHIRLGLLTFLACFGIASLCSSLAPRVLARYIYLICCALAALSVPYTWVNFGEFVRIGGLVSQADVLACFCGVGLLISLRLTLQPRLLLWLGQILLFAVLLLTETRAVIFLVIILAVIHLVWDRKMSYKKLAPAVIFSVILVLSLAAFYPSRLTSAEYASQSLNYRAELQKTATESSFRKPLFGYGAGNLANSLSCKQMHAAALRQSCHDGYIFDSSHNIYLDRMLSVGWVGGLAFMAFVAWAFYRGFQNYQKVQILLYPALLICFYYFTNVTSVALELLFWILLFSVATWPTSRASTSR
jgi:O-antigen ligase